VHGSGSALYRRDVPVHGRRLSGGRGARCRGRHDEVAAKFLHLALEIDPDIYGNAHRYARFLVERGDRSEALDVIAKGLEHGAPDREELLGLQDWILESE